GTLYLRANTLALRQKITRYTITVLSIMGAMIAISFILALRLQGLISRPILKLAGAAKRISEKGDYSHRVPPGSGDEIGDLYDGFNNMLDQIEKRQQERDRAEEALKLSEKRFRHIVQQSNDILFVIGGNRFLFVNPKFEEYLGYTMQEVS